MERANQRRLSLCTATSEIASCGYGGTTNCHLYRPRRSERAAGGLGFADQGRITRRPNGALQARSILRCESLFYQELAYGLPIPKCNRTNESHHSRNSRTVLAVFCFRWDSTKTNISIP